MIRLGFGLFLTGLLLAFASPASGQMGKIDTTHVSDESFCVVRIDVGKLVGHLKKSRKDFDMLAREFGSESGIDLGKLDCLTLQYGDFDLNEGEPSFAVTFEFAEKIDRKGFLSGALGNENFDETTVNGKTYLKPNSKFGPHIYFESDQKFTMATPAAIEAILNAGGGMGKMPSLLKSLPPGAEIIAVYQKRDKTGVSIKSFLSSLQNIPGSLKLDELILSSQSGTAYFDLSSGTPFHLQLTLDSEETAANARNGINELVSMGKTALPPVKSMVQQQIKEIEKSEDDRAMELEMMQAGLRGLDLGEKMLGGLAVSADDKSLELKVTHMGGMIEVADLLVTGIKAMFFGVSSRLEGLDDGPEFEIERVERKGPPPVRSTTKDRE